MDKESAEIIASAIRSAGRDIGVGDAATTMGGLELVAMEIKASSERIEFAILDLASAIRESAG